MNIQDIIENLQEKNRQLRELNPNKFAHLLIRHKIIDKEAIYDPEGYDNYTMLNAVYAAAKELTDILMGE